MDPIVTIALVGTARQETIHLVTGTPVDALLTRLPEGEIERTLLLSAGAWAVYRQAGIQARQVEALPEPAEVEQLSECSLGAALLLSRLLSGEQAALLPEALERLSQKGAHLPYHLLPQALNTTDKETRAALFPVLGARGRWLSRFNPSWRWVQDYLPTDVSDLPADAETIWQEGSLGQRAEILRRLRAIDPDKARAWLESVWRQEKAEARCDLLEALEIGLSLSDEPFLEKALDDRAASVRAGAVALLARLPNSAFGERMRKRGENILKVVKGKLVIKPPTSIEKDWQRDGVVENPPRKLAKRAWWLIQTLASIPPTFWETYLNAQPAELLKLFAGDTWEVQVVEGLSKAAISYEASDWVMPLWTWWYEHYQAVVEKKELSDYTLREELLKRMPGPIAEQTILALINGREGELPIDWWELLPELPRPWSVEFARTYLRLFYKYCTVQRVEAENFNPYSDPWFDSLPPLALALPAACFAEALRPLELPESAKWQVQYARQRLQEFAETIDIRQKIQEEIA